MAAFAAGDADVLVATTVIEVGIDVPNATVMLVEDAERYGISQLHQLRGRVGRGQHPSLCLLFGPAESRRLKALAEHSDGFRLAEIDLELRGEGELTGTRQSGLARFTLRAAARRRGAAGARPRRRAGPARRGPRPGRARARAARRRASPGARPSPSRHEGRRRPLRRPHAARRRAGADGARPPTASARRCSRSSARSTAWRVLDLFAGSGALGIEALSRGRGLRVFVDVDTRPVAARNLEALGIDAEVRRGRALSALKRGRSIRSRPSRSAIPRRRAAGT